MIGGLQPTEILGSSCMGIKTSNTSDRKSAVNRVISSRKEGMLTRFIYLSHVAPASSPAPPHFPLTLQKEKWNSHRRLDRSSSNVKFGKGSWCWEGRNCASRRCYSCSALSGDYEEKSMGVEAKEVWVWAENKAVMTAAVEKGWNTCLFMREVGILRSNGHDAALALRNPLFVEEGCIFDSEKCGVATISHASTPEEVLNIQSEEGGPVQHLDVDLLDWQVIPAENLVAAFQGCQKTVLAVSRSHGEAQVCLEALEHGLSGVVLKAEDVDAILGLKVTSFNQA